MRTIEEIRRYARMEVEAPANQKLIGELCDEIDRLRADRTESSRADWYNRLTTKLTQDRVELFEIVTQSEMRCNCPSDDGSDDCANIDDCLFHSMLRLCGPELEPIESQPTSPAPLTAERVGDYDIPNPLLDGSLVDASIAPPKRAETGVMEFENDWPGIFIRGDAALGGYGFPLNEIADRLECGCPLTWVAIRKIRNLAKLLMSCDASTNLERQYAKLQSSKDKQNG